MVAICSNNGGISVFPFCSGDCSKCVSLETAILREWKNRDFFANPTFIFRGVAAIHFCAVDTHSNSMQMVTAWAIQETAKGRCQGHVGKIPPENSKVSLFTTFPWLAAAKVQCGLLASMDTFSFATAFVQLSRDFREKSFANQPKNPHPESWLGV